MQYPVFRSLVSTFYPIQCLACEHLLVRGEKQVCLSCFDGLIPFENFDQKKFRVDHLFWGLANVNNAFSLYFYVKDERLAQLIHAFKYQGKRNLGDVFAKLLKNRFFDADELSDVDGIIFVPMHRKKERKRGYNQAKILADKLSELTKIPVVSILKKGRKSQTQTSKNVFERHVTLQGNFQIKEQRQQWEHLLLVDDVITTGATATECINLIHSYYDVKISVLTIAHRDI